LLALFAGVDPAEADPREPHGSIAPNRAPQELLDQGDLRGAEEGAARLLENARPADRSDSLALMDGTRILIEARLRLGRYDDPSLPGLLNSYFSLCRALYGPEPCELVRGYQYAGFIARSLGDYEKALEHYQRALDVLLRCVGPDDPETAAARSNLATACFAMGDYAKARELLEQVRQVQEKQTPLARIDLATTLLNLNEAKLALGDTSGVTAGYARAAGIFEQLEKPSGAGTANLLHREGSWRLQCKDAAGAARLLRRAVSIREITDPGGADLAASLLALSSAYGDLAKADSASVCATRALQIYEAIGPREDAEIAGCLVALGDAARQTSHQDEAMEHYIRALGILRRPPARDRVGLADCLGALAALSLELAHNEDALTYAREALEVSERHWGPDRRETAIARVAYAAALRSALQPDSAAVQYERALTDLTKILGAEDPTLAEALLGRGGLARERGDLPSARADAERAEGLLERAFGPEYPRLAGCLHELAIAQRQLGDDSGAQASLERALRLARARRSETPEVAAILSSLATLERARGHAPAAEAHFREALGILERVLPPDHPESAQILRQLASLENAAGRFGEAETHYRRALEILERTLPGHPDVAAAHLGLGNTLKARGDAAGARDHYRRAIAIHREALGPEAVALALDYHNLAGLLLESGDPHAAMDTAAIAEDLSLRHFRLIAQGVSEREALHYSAGRVRGTDIVLTCAARSESPADWRKAWDLVIRSRGIVLEEMADRHRILATVHDSTTASLDSELTAAANHLAQLAVRGRGTLSHEHYQSALEDARRQKEAAERALAERSTPFRQRRTRQEAGFNEVAAELPSKSALIAWVCFNRMERTVSQTGESQAPNPMDASGVPSYGAFIIGAPGREVRFVALGTAKEIDQQIVDWHREAGSGPRLHSRNTAQLAYLQAGQALRRAIWDPVALGLEGSERIFLVPDGALALVNFDALPEEGGEYLMEKAPLLRILSSERDLIRDEAQGPPGVGLLTVAAPDFDQVHTRDDEKEGGPRDRAATRGIPCGQFRALLFDSLPGARDEEIQVVRLWQRFGAERAPGSPERQPGILELVGPAATEREFRRSAPGHSVLHIATHGFFLGAKCMGDRSDAGAAEPDELTLNGLMAESPLLLSGLALAGANQRERAPSSEDDGILTAEEIAALNLGGVDCVVLSACETGLGQVEAGEGVFGLRRAFQVAGARSLVMTLWAVDDAATALWMAAMFEQRLRNGRTVSEAVRAASLEVLQKRRTDGLDTHPYYWGAFVATGDWR